MVGLAALVTLLPRQWTSAQETDILCAIPVRIGIDSLKSFMGREGWRLVSIVPDEAACGRECVVEFRAGGTGHTPILRPSPDTNAPGARMSLGLFERVGLELRFNTLFQVAMMTRAFGSHDSAKAVAQELARLCDRALKNERDSVATVTDVPYHDDLINDDRLRQWLWYREQCSTETSIMIEASVPFRILVVSIVDYRCFAASDFDGGRKNKRE